MAAEQCVPYCFCWRNSLARRAGAALRVTAEALDAVSPGADEVCAINSSALRGVGFVFNLAVLIDSGADEGAGQVGSAVRVSLSPSAVAACFPLPFCCKLRCSCLGSSAVQSAFPFQSYLVEQSCPGGGAVPVPLGQHAACSAAAFGDGSFHVSKVTGGKSSWGGTAKSSRR